ncbi:hypothetical protein DN752_01870 [Echinicola strongylocentroti]|uniref:Aerotolerance regulator BatC n=2 Tax=Echinicola strongylocentroti TaxID=1795355 RepID=A0A2Z4IDV2_9BACT|nr:hypothetical protein DN752_01870 [Echinicola strongylocentroti]
MKSMKINIPSFLGLFAVMWAVTFSASAQTADTYFNQAAKNYVNADYPGVGQTLAEGLQKFPDDPKLNALKEKLKDEQEKQDQEQKEQQDQQDQQQQEQQKQNEDQQQQGDENQQQEDQGQQEKESKDGQGEEQTEEDGAQESDKMDEKRGEKSNQQEPSDESSDMESDLSEREKAMEELRQKLQQMNISPEQAQQILDAMDNAEMRYIQQTKKKASKRPDKNLPDW